MAKCIYYVIAIFFILNVLGCAYANAIDCLKELEKVNLVWRTKHTFKKDEWYSADKWFLKLNNLYPYITQLMEHGSGTSPVNVETIVSFLYRYIYFKYSVKQS
ncbi:uncharacterized protein LOC100572351 isoform X2 [Acyrthosiphon pisum]|uniref:Uncharacterized protein n=1 Tax=Acyrthosiphon pisum TaxID=7029 RepID=A0A8R2D6L5_ACYPI|nr:uncharacterized protein LOC100572351 isoform X2 [Acyrthosiphon pisum]|eukprot:XP_016664117.1 PREDICTED: uncharacterized protein LOC100572351 isoform X2 [Acyrthosiphon pisum]